MFSEQAFDSLYLHVPFCKNICDYCVLYSVLENDAEVRQQYLSKIKSDFHESRQYLQDVKTIFVGGGTPSALNTQELGQFLDIFQELSPLEFSMECNPNSISEEKLRIMIDKGVNRLSFGGQSTSRSTRKVLGRRTGDQELFKAVELAQELGFDRINVDLIYGVPGQSLADWQYDLDKVLSLGVKHFSAYSLILEEGAKITQRIDELDDDLAVEMYRLCEEALEKYGLKRYEVSNYAMLGQECKHNLGIWQGAKYLGIGPAAASFDGDKRWTEIADLSAWLEGEEVEVDEISHLERLCELLAFGFRTVEGWKKQRLKSFYQSNVLIECKEIIENLMRDGLIEETASHLRPTQEGLLFADVIAEKFISFGLERRLS